MSKMNDIMEAIAQNPDATNADLASQFNTNEATVKRSRTKLNKEREERLNEIPEEPESKNEPKVEVPVAGLTPDQVQALALFVANLNKKEDPSEVKPSNECIRHAGVKLIDGNCPACLSQSKVEDQRLKNNRYMLPCPKCDNNLTPKDGGVIRRTKLGSYLCGSCQITYNEKGEVANWGTETRSF